MLEPVETTGLTPADVPALKERVRQLIIETRAELAVGAPGSGAAMSAHQPARRRHAFPRSAGARTRPTAPASASSVST